MFLFFLLAAFGKRRRRQLVIKGFYPYETSIYCTDIRHKHNAFDCSFRVVSDGATMRSRIPTDTSTMHWPVSDRSLFPAAPAADTYQIHQVRAGAGPLTDRISRM